MNRIEINSQTVENINKLADGQYFTLCTNSSNFTDVEYDTRNFTTDAVVFNVLTASGDIYKRSLKLLPYKSFKQFIVRYGNLTGIGFRKNGQISSLEDLINTKKSISFELNKSLICNDYYKLDLSLEGKPVAALEARIYDNDASIYPQLSEQLRLLYLATGYSQLALAAIELENGQPIEIGQLRAKFGKDLNSISLYQYVEKLYYTVGKR